MEKRGKWNVAEAFELDKVTDLIDTNMGNRIADDIRRELGVN